MEVVQWQEGDGNSFGKRIEVWNPGRFSLLGLRHVPPIQDCYHAKELC
jgi:hypothetical protein